MGSVVVVGLAALAVFTPAGNLIGLGDTPGRSSQPSATGPQVSLRRLGDCAVAKVVDGDTFTCATGQRVRVLGADAPELAHDGQPQQCYARTAQAALKHLVAGQTVTLSSDEGQPGQDAYGRTLAYVTTPAGKNVSLRLVQDGNARARTSKPALSLASDLARAQRAAQANREGLWGTC